MITANPELRSADSDRRPPRTSALATWSLISAISGYLCLWGLGGLLAVALGIMAKGEIERSEGRTTGSGLALAGIVLGALNMLLWGAAFGALLAWRWPSTSKPAPTVAATTVPAPAPSPRPAAPRISASASPAHAASREDGAIVTRVGAIDLVDLSGDSGKLRDELEAQRKVADKRGQKLVLWTVQDDCKPCNGVAAALVDGRMQQALEKVRIVRVDRDAFRVELERLHVPIKKVPGFALLGPRFEPVDFVHGGEWDADIPANIAPVLGKFVRGKYRGRRDPWPGVHRGDETAL